MDERPTPKTDAECFVNEGDFVTGDFARTLERQRDELLEALEDIANMPEHDQDDAHRLRYKARAAIAAVKGELCDDGTVWELRDNTVIPEWIKLPEIPQDNEH